MFIVICTFIASMCYRTQVQILYILQVYMFINAGRSNRMNSIIHIFLCIWLLYAFIQVFPHHFSMYMLTCAFHFPGTVILCHGVCEWWWPHVPHPEVQALWWATSTVLFRGNHFSPDVSSLQRDHLQVRNTVDHDIILSLYL